MPTSPLGSFKLELPETAELVVVMVKLDDGRIVARTEAELLELNRKAAGTPRRPIGQ